MLIRNWKVLISNLLFQTHYYNGSDIDASKYGRFRCVDVSDNTTPIYKNWNSNPDISSTIYQGASRGVWLTYFLPLGCSCLVDYTATGGNALNTGSELGRVNNVTTSNDDQAGYSSTNTKAGGYCYLWWGTGTTAPTEDDYRLEAPITLQTTATFTDTANRLCPIYSEVTGDRQNGTMTFTQHVYCCSPSVTINEYGLFKYMNYNAIPPAPTATNANLVMYAREVLSEPITITQGQTLKFSYTISCFDCGTESSWVTGTSQQS